MLLFPTSWRLAYATPEEQGFDPTVKLVLPSDQEYELAKTAFAKFPVDAGDGGCEEKMLFKFEVLDENKRFGSLSHYIARRAQIYPRACIGRCTFGYVAYSVET